MLTVNTISDSTIFTMLAENNSSTWEVLYDKYSAIMYGAVFQITNDERLSRTIFQECFLELKNKKSISKIKTDLCAFLLKFTYNFSIDYLKAMGLMHEIENINCANPDPLTELLSSKYVALKKPTAEEMSSQQKEARRKLRAEFNQLRNQLGGNLLYSE